MSIISLRQSDATQALSVDLSLYSLPAVFSAVYKFTDRLYLYLIRDHEDLESKLWVLMFAKNPKTDISPMVMEFMNELADQQLRRQLAAEFNDVRTLIVAQAFSEGNLLTPDDDSADYRKDPRGAGSHR